jgi:hypothetical protein
LRNYGRIEEREEKLVFLSSPLFSVLDIQQVWVKVRWFWRKRDFDDSFPLPERYKLLFCFAVAH